ncbi:uncharacterized protein LOC115226298 [Octopus sinensis]|uniref:Uncharacterized protein LOC115226298 n=1 Tax=Octopus sinensis TaxID=2607531 RepID=A0A6P7TWH9_9MOLL|nr:uncharacterized protein LOC115226298 [Octopus sinensis]
MFPEMLPTLFEILTLVLLLQFHGSDSCLGTCKPLKSKPPPHIFRLLPQMFKARIQLTDVMRNQTTLVEEYYDMTKLKAGSITEYRRHRKKTQIFDYKHQKIVYYNATSCWVSPLSSKANFDIPFKSCVDIFRLNTNFEAQVADAVIDGIPVKAVRSCVCEPSLNMTIEYFLRADTAFLSLETTGPVRVEMKGIVKRRNGKTEPFTYIYQFLTFDPTPTIGEDVFQVPQGVICNTSIYYHQLPNILPQFTTHGEIINTRNHRLSVFNVLFDWQEKLMRLEFYPEVHGNSSDRSIRMITDYRLGIQYNLDNNFRPCLIKPSYTSLTDLEKLSWSHVLHVDDIYSLMTLNTAMYNYKGKLKVRGLTVDVWGRKSTITGGITINREYYFLKTLHTAVPIGIFQKAFRLPNNNNKNNEDKDDDDDDDDDGTVELINESWIHLYGYVQGHVHLDNFNIESCFHLRDRFYINFQLEDKFDIYIKGYESLIFPSLRNSLARAANVSSVRISNIQIGRLSSDLMVVQFTLLDAPSIPGSLKTRYTPIPLEEAYSNLKSHKEIEFKVLYPLMHEKVFRFHTNQLQSLVREFSSSSTDPTRRGAMVGLGLGMLFIGVCSGLLAGYFIYRRVLSADIPYELTK